MTKFGLREGFPGLDMGSGSMIVAPGVFDGLSAKLAEQAGFGALYMTGAGISASRGYPDFGLVTMSEMIDAAAVVASSTGVPVISDADTGYGNELNVTRTVHGFIRAGVAAIHIEDQLAPKRCGHLGGKELVPQEEFLSKIRAAVAARGDSALRIIARTDARAVTGFDDAVARANMALAAGADAAFVEAPETLDEVALIPQLVNGPCLLNMVPNSRTPLPSLAEAEIMGYRVAICPAVCLFAAVTAVEEALRTLARGQQPETDETVTTLFERVGASDWNALRGRFSSEILKLDHEAAK